MYKTKKFSVERWGLEKAEYVCCWNCGFTAFKTHFDMDETEWSDLNHRFHSTVYDLPGDPYGREARLTNQAKIIQSFKNTVGSKMLL